MKILALSDIHGDRTFIKEMAEKGANEKVDLVILAGDLVDFSGNPEGIVGPFKEKGLEVAVLPGNHEGMAEVGKLHPLQESAIEHNAVQCGYCTPGWLLSAKVLLDNNPDPTLEEVKAGIAGNLCRCTGYGMIVDAAKIAAEKGEGLW